MQGEVIKLPSQQPVRVDEMRSRLRRMGSIITVIETAELLSALPVCQVARANHLEALDLLAILGDEIQSLTEQLA